MIQLAHCTIEFHDWGVVTAFEDGSEICGAPHPELPHYSVIAHRCGYGDDLLRYTQEHDAAHSLMAEFLSAKPSAVLWAKAHGCTPSYAETISEEITAQTFQRWLRANERPIIADCPWDAWKAQALRLLDGERS